MIKEKGSILIFTLWVLIILAILSIILSHRASSDVKLAKYESDKIKATYLAKAGVVKMLAELAKDKAENSYDSLNEDWNRDKDNPKELKLAGATIYYGASDESGRLNLNSSITDKIYKDRLVGLDIRIDEYLAGEILNYKKGKGEKGFEFIEELFLVGDGSNMTAEIFSAIKDFVTVYRGTESKVNINTASEKILYAITDDVNLVPEILRYRKEGEDGDEYTIEDNAFRSDDEISVFLEKENSEVPPAYFSVNSDDYFRIWAEVSLTEDKEIVKSVEAVVNRSGKIYHWNE